MKSILALVTFASLGIPFNSWDWVAFAVVPIMISRMSTETLGAVSVAARSHLSFRTSLCLL